VNPGSTARKEYEKLSEDRRRWMNPFRFLRRLGRLPGLTRGTSGNRHGGQGFSNDLNKNLATISAFLGKPSDLVIRRLSLRGDPPSSIAVVYLGSMVDTETVRLTVVQPLLSFSHVVHKTAAKTVSPLETLRLTLPTARATFSARSMNELITLIPEGKVAVLIDGASGALYLDASRRAARALQVPTSESTVIGPQIGFNESIDDNLSLIRSRLKHPKLRVEQVMIGRKSRTDVRMVYLEGIAPDEIVAELRRRLHEIDTDIVLDPGMIRDLITEQPYSPFILERTTERPDTVAAEVNLGRIALLVEGSPFALLQPSQLFTLIESAEDYYLNALSASLLRLLRALAYILSVLATPTYVAIVNFHFELVPLPLLLNIAATEEGVPFPLPVAAFFTEVVLDIVREAGVRLPSQFGPVVSIFGAVILGQSAIQAGFVAPGLIIVAMLGTICSFAVPRAEKALAYRLIRFPLLLLASILGFPGLTIGGVATVYHIASLKTLGVPYSVLYTPGHAARLSRKLVRVPARRQPVTRPLAQVDRVRSDRVPEPRDPKNDD
jgi:spore germination protein KA